MIGIIEASNKIIQILHQGRNEKDTLYSYKEIKKFLKRYRNNIEFSSLLLGLLRYNKFSHAPTILEMISDWELMSLREDIYFIYLDYRDKGMPTSLEFFFLKTLSHLQFDRAIKDYLDFINECKTINRGNFSYKNKGNQFTLINNLGSMFPEEGGGLLAIYYVNENEHNKIAKLSSEFFLFNTAIRLILKRHEKSSLFIRVFLKELSTLNINLLQSVKKKIKFYSNDSEQTR
ncbi:MAG: hypothetical protein ACJAY8_000636 [Sphingobacteriales bacterium]|jgi:hypothetical protein